jgi:hypothetical protein
LLLAAESYVEGVTSAAESICGTRPVDVKVKMHETVHLAGENRKETVKSRAIQGKSMIDRESAWCLLDMFTKAPATKKMLYKKLLVSFCVVSIMSVLATPAASGDDSNNSVAQLIDELTQIDSQSPAIDSAAIYDGFIADNRPGSFEVGVLGVPDPKVPPQMRELVRRGAKALPDLIGHLGDSRQTKLKVGNKDGGRQVGMDAFMFMYFSDEYDPRLPHWFTDEELKSGPRPMEKDFHGTYTVKVGDVCYVLIGQIVNRSLLAVRYQPSGGLVVNSPIEAPSLVGKVRDDWGNADAETLKRSLLEDIHATNQPKRIGPGEYTARFVDPALERLRFYFPDTYKALAGDDLKKKKKFEKQETKSRQN